MFTQPACVEQNICVDVCSWYLHGNYKSRGAFASNWLKFQLLQQEPLLHQSRVLPTGKFE
jgi:hypothetical protein